MEHSLKVSGNYPRFATAYFIHSVVFSVFYFSVLLELQTYTITLACGKAKSGMVCVWNRRKGNSSLLFILLCRYYYYNW